VPSAGGFCLHLADELTTESVDDTGHRRLLALANEVEVKHTLHSLGLHAAVEIVSLAGFQSLTRGAGVLRALSFARGKRTRRNILSWGGRACGPAEG
jgi:hypothetical protein